MRNLFKRINQIDKRISRFMKTWGIVSLRISLAIIFFWFGILKPLELSPAAPLVKATVHWMPYFSPDIWLYAIGIWEMCIGITFLFPSTTRVAIALLAGQMFGTFLPLFILPEVCFQEGHFPYALTIEGQYIVKNLLIIASALVVGGTVRENS